MRILINFPWQIALLCCIALTAGCSDSDSGPALPAWEDAPCETVSSLNQYDGLMSRWKEQTDAAPFEAGRMVFTGSSSIRFWEQLQEDLSPWAPIQRGFGGAISWNLVEYIDETIIRHDPAAVVIFVGTNDIAVDLGPTVVVDSYRCIVETVAQELGDDVSIHYIAITPTPLRWDQWSEANQANEEIAALASQWRGLHFIDTSPAFLATGEPPAADLFISDGLHLSDAGYAIWAEEIREHLEATVPKFSAVFDPLEPGTTLLVDLGPGNPEDGLLAPSPDGFGRHWNSWHPVEANTLLSSGEHLGSLVTTSGEATSLRLTFSGATKFSAGLRDGGLLDPSEAFLGDLAVPEATADFLYVSATGTVLVGRGSLTFEGLDPDASLQLRLFASRAGLEMETVVYRVSGAGAPQSRTLNSSGDELASGDGFAGNQDTVVMFEGLAADTSGRLHVDFEPQGGALGSTASLALIELKIVP